MPANRIAVTSSYRPDIDGLRAVAVISVLLFHAFPEYVSGGFVGVDVFFVISGFLISNIIFNEIAAGSFSLRRFYARRVRRIFPALAVFLLLSVAAGWWILLPAAFREFGNEVAASALFFANIYFWFQSGYFSPDSQTLPLLHLWSLGVEEQFYIAWPIILIALRRTKWFFSAIVVIALASFCFNLAIADHRDSDFYSPFTRAWELMLGAALAWHGCRPERSFTISGELATVAGITLIVSSCFLFDRYVQYPSWRALLPTLGAALIIWSGKTAIAAVALSGRPIVEIGRFSYPLYLWHWPLLVFGAAFKAAPLTLAERGLAMGAAFLLAWITYRFVETPLRFRLPLKRSISISVTGMAVAGLAGLALILGNGFEARFPQDIRAIAKWRDYPDEWRIHRCLLELPLETEYATDCIDPNRRPLVLLWGDSTGAALMPGLRELQKSTGLGIAQLTASQCEPLLAMDIVGSPRCRKHNDEVLSAIKTLQPDVVLLHGSGSSYPDSIPGIERTISALRQAGVPKVVVLSPAPVWRRGLPGQVVHHFLKHREMIPNRSSDLVFRKWDEADMRKRIEKLGSTFISSWDVLCNEQGCLTKVGANPTDLVANDSQHLTAAGSIYLLNAVRTQLLP